MRTIQKKNCRWWTLLIMLIPLALITACGGGGGSDVVDGSDPGDGGIEEGEYVIFLANQDENAPEDYNLYLANSQNPETLTKLNPPGAAVHGDVIQMAFSPDGAYAVYLADQESNGIYELYLVDMASPGTPVKLNGTLVSGGRVDDFTFSPDSSRVAYRADQDTAGVNELYLAAVASPGTSVKINSALPDLGDVEDFSFSPDSSMVAYMADQDTDEHNELYLVDLAAPETSDKLNGALVADGDVLEFAFNPGSYSVVYRADQDRDRVFELYTVDIVTPGTSVKLNSSLVEGGDIADFLISRDGIVFYRADQDIDGTYEVYAVTTPGSSLKLNSPLSAGESVTKFILNYNGSAMAYRADQDIDGVHEIYYVTGGAITKINKPLVAGRTTGDFAFSPDGTLVGYIADQDTDDVYELYTVDLTELVWGSTKRNTLLVADREITDFQFRPDSQGIIYRADHDTKGVYELYSASLSTPGTAYRLNSPLPAGGQVRRDFSFHPDSTLVAYRADQENYSVDELYYVDITSPGDVFKLNSTLATGIKIVNYQVSPDGKQVVYCADQDMNAVFELYLLDITRPGTSVKLSGALVADGDVSYDGFKFSPDSSRVAYYADQDTDEVYELYLVDTATPGTSVKLNSALVADGDVSTDAIAFSPDGKHMVYRADQDTDQVYELYLVDLTAPGASVKLNSPRVAGGDILGSAFSPDGSQVVYRADQDIDEMDELYLVDVSTPGTSTKINSALAADADITRFVISPDGRRIAYRADHDTDEVFELYLTDMSTPGTSVKLNSALTIGGNVYSSGFTFSPDGSQVLYRADQDIDGTVELYLVDLTAPGTSAKLNSALVADGDVSSHGLSFSHDSSHVVYCADQDTDDIYEIYSVSVASPGVSTKLNQPLAEGSEVYMHGVSPDSITVSFVTHQEIDDTPLGELYLVRQDDPGNAIRLNIPRTGTAPYLYIEAFSFVPGEVFYTYH
ncbi:MAG: hypothetical protein HKM93_01245 [Desulfobacteraceae bacterium]|nr:hypothetical protein [Desulfobacteraceae bacterium]